MGTDKQKMKLTNRQKELMRDCKKRGYITLNDLVMAYATTQSRQEFLNRLSSGEYIKEDKVPGRFVFTEKVKDLEFEEIH